MAAACPVCPAIRFSGGAPPFFLQWRMRANIGAFWSMEGRTTKRMVEPRMKTESIWEVRPVGEV